jgi:hypothetical protein
VVELFKQKASAFGLPNEVHLNLVFKGGYITQSYSTLLKDDLQTDYPVQSFQMEYSTAITHDQKTLEPNHKAIESLRTCWEEVISEAYKWWVGEMSV